MDFDLSDVQRLSVSEYTEAYDNEKSHIHRKLEEDLDLIAEMSKLTVDLGLKELQLELEDFNELLDKLKL